MMRLFIALPLPDSVKSRLGTIIDELRSQGGSVRWVDPKNLHLTIRFLGDAEEAAVRKLEGVVARAAAEHQAVITAVEQIGAFPNLRRPRVFWVGLGGNTEVLEKMARMVELAVRELRFPKETKQFRPHLTLGRVRHMQGLEKLSAYVGMMKFDPIPMEFDRLVLFKSTLTPKGPIYERLYEAMLGEQRMGG